MAETADVLELHVSGDEREKMRTWLKEQIQRGVAVSTIARETGYSHSAISQFLSRGKASKNLINKLKIFKEKVDSATAAGGIPAKHEWEGTAVENGIPSAEDLIETEDLQAVKGLCALCQADGEIGVITGPPGSGKTKALEEFCSLEPFTAYIRADVTMSGRELVKELGDKLGVVMEGSQRNKVKQIIRRLKDSPVLVIVDEADLLVSRDSVKKLEILRTIWDEAQCGMILAGLPRLASFLVKGPGGNENLSQFYSRVRRAYAMKGVSRSEILQALTGYDMADSARNYLATAATSKAQGGLRRFKRLLQNSLELIEPGETITLEIVKEADNMLVSPRTLGLAF